MDTAAAAPPSEGICIDPHWTDDFNSWDLVTNAPFGVPDACNRPSRVSFYSFSFRAKAGVGITVDGTGTTDTVTTYNAYFTIERL
jgi:hypothetical protein